MVAYVVTGLDDVGIAPDDVVDGMDLMSPFVWQEGGHLRMLLRAVPRPQAADSVTGLIYGARSDDGLTFTVDPKPAIAPGPEELDGGGCEDPTVVPTDGSYSVYYTGVSASRPQGSLLVAEGPDIARLQKRAVALQAPPGEGNIKEATVVQAPDGSWRLFYEYARDNASRIGLARSDGPHGPWTSLDDPFDIRDDGWDNWHLSTGPIQERAGADPVMFYNGATIDARWRIGWISFSADYSRVTGRGIEPVLMPPPPKDRGATDIAFAASSILAGDRIQLYYSLEDRRLCRATIRWFD